MTIYPRQLTAVADPDLQIRGGRSHPDPEIRGVCGHPDPEIRGGGGLKKNFLGAFGPHFYLKLGGRAPEPLPWIHHCTVQGSYRVVSFTMA